MWFLRKHIRKRAKTNQAQRQRVRHATQGLSCELGDIADLSADGMRVRLATKPVVGRGDSGTWIVASASQKIRVSGRVRWVERTGWSQWQVGVEFVNADTARRVALELLAKHGFVTPGAHSAAELGGTQRGSAAGARPEPLRAAIEVEDLYALMGVARDADAETIKSTFRRLARELHPDHGETGDQERFVRVNRAYTVLRDPELRKRYDEMLKRAA